MKGGAGGFTILRLLFGEEVALGGRFDVSFWMRCDAMRCAGL
jgi:hypothetical protein